MSESTLADKSENQRVDDLVEMTENMQVVESADRRVVLTAVDLVVRKAEKLVH